jgi:hypothetical protein
LGRQMPRRGEHNANFLLFSREMLVAVLAARVNSRGWGGNGRMASPRPQ